MTTLNHRNRRAVNNHSIYQTDLHTSTNSLLNSIKDNTANVNVNTDTLEALIGTDTSHTPLSLTALTRNQKDLLENKLGQIASFLDKDNSQFHLKHHPDDHHVMFAGNTAADGSGTKNHVHVDGSGVLKVSQVSSQNIDPANLSNADHASHSKTFAVGLRGRTNITDETSGKFLLCDTNGHLQTDIANQPNFKLEDLSSSLNAQHASGTSRSMAVGLKASTDISDVVTGSKFLHCTSAGELDTITTTKTLDTTHAGVFVTINAGAVDGEITLGDRDNYVRYMIQKASSGFFDIHIEGSNDNTNFIPLQEITSAGAGSDFYGTALIHNPPKYLRLKNNNAGAQALKIQIVSGRN